MKVGLLFLLITYTLTAQQWIDQNPKISERPISDIKFKDDSTGYFITGGAIWKSIKGGVNFNKVYDTGDPGNYYSERKIYLWGDTLVIFNTTSLIKSNDAGNSWQMIPLSFSDGFVPGRSYFLNPSWGVLISSGSENRFKKTTDGGLTWVTLNAPMFATGIYFSDQLHGILSTDTYNQWMTMDGGSTWRDLQLTGNFADSELFNYKNTVVIKSFKAGTFVSTDFGYTWTKRVLNPYGKLIIRDSFMLLFVDFSDRWIYISYDRGITWERYYSPGRVNISMEALNDSTFFVGGEDGSLYKATDRGKNWKCLTNPAFYLSSVFFTDCNNGFIGGENFMRTTNGGRTWEILYNVPGYFSPIYFIDSTTGFAQFEESGTMFTSSTLKFLKTTNKGDTWDTLFSRVYNDYYKQIFKIYFKDRLNGFVIGGDIYFTTSDGGYTWDFHPGQNYSGMDMSFSNEKKGIIASFEGGGYVTSDGGITWVQRQDLGGTSIFFADSQTVYLTNRYHLKKSTDGGNNFFLIINTGQSDDFRGLKFWDKDTGIMQNNYIHSLAKTTNGGINWQGLFSWGDDSKFYTYFHSPDLGWLVGRDGGIYKYTNQLVPVELLSFTAEGDGKNVKLNWSTSTETNNKGFTLMRKAHSEDWKEIAFISGSGTTTEKKEYSYRDNVPISGKYYYKLLQIDLDGTTKIGKEIEISIAGIPESFTLYQNYPNPFNPSTKIKYSLPFESSTHIIIYNAIGQVVKTITPGDEKAGIHEINFDASGIASGIYFCAIKAVSANGKVFNAVNKMVYLK